MLTIYGKRRAGYCDGVSRRSFLKVGAVGVAGLTLADVFRMEALAGGAPAVAPPGLNVYSEVPYRISQQASATLEGDNNGTLLYSNSLSPYRVGRYPASNGDGSYLLLIHPDQAQRSATQAPARSQ